ncbi:hypothetical protein DFH29DRAFT_813166 [Suillus ampliporus]|nr:hypothetical protein DFH29DRAFT_813166 [Suillus ampliporus]
MAGHHKQSTAKRLKVPHGVLHTNAVGLQTNATNADGSDVSGHCTHFKSAATVVKESEEELKKCRDMLLSLPTETCFALSSITEASGADPDKDIGLDPSQFNNRLSLFDEQPLNISHEGGEITDALQTVMGLKARAKYPLALTDFILDAFGKDVGIGYDVGCTFGKIICNSPLLGAKAGANQLQVIINSFHGYAHNRSCQLRYHPLYQPGFGIEDLKTMERVFSSSNSVSRSVRYASKFHWVQSIDLHFQQWDDNKYVELSKFILNNYQQALSIISEFSGAISNFATSLNIEEDEFERWLEAEQEYLDNLIDEPEEHVITCAYRTRHQHSSVNYSEDAHETLRLETAWHSSMDVLLVNICTVADLEERLGIKDRWTDDQPDYRKALGYRKTHKFRHALDKLQQLVVQRLFELSKANMSGTGGAPPPPPQHAS